MSFIFNDPSDFVTEMLEGFLAAHAGQVIRLAGGVVRAHETPSGEVAVVTGGGSGHYPAFCGLVGPGLAHGAAMGEVFASPSASRVLSVVKAVHAGAGVFFTYGNYAGDGLNFDAAQDQLRGEGVSCHTVRVTDDVSSAPREERHQRAIPWIALSLWQKGQTRERSPSGSPSAGALFPELRNHSLWSLRVGWVWVWVSTVNPVSGKGRFLGLGNSRPCWSIASWRKSLWESRSREREWSP